MYAQCTLNCRYGQGIGGNTATPLLVEDEFFVTAEELLKWTEQLAVKHKKPKLHDNAWLYVQALPLVGDKNIF